MWKKTDFYEARLRLKYRKIFRCIYKHWEESTWDSSLEDVSGLDLTVISILQEKAMATHSSTLAWKIPWTEEPGGLQSMGSHRVGHHWSDLAAVAAAASIGPDAIILVFLIFSFKQSERQSERLYTTTNF